MVIGPYQRDVKMKNATLFLFIALIYHNSTILIISLIVKSAVLMENYL